ncbi:MAG: hypothetical protein Kow0098_02800 [Ignavibacteriaceae bacterium]
MNRKLKLLTLFFLPVLFAGCIRMNSTVYVKKDGSGTLETKVLMSGMLIAMMNEFSSSMDSTEKFSLLDEEELRNNAAMMGEGVRFISASEITEGDMQGYLALYEFDDIKKLRIEPNPDNVMPADESTAEENKEFLTFNFVPGDEAVLTIRFPDKEPEENTDADTTSEFGSGEETMMQMMKDFRFNIQLVVDGKITNTNASRFEESKVTLLDIDFGKIMENKENFKTLMKDNPSSIEEMKEYVKMIPGFFIELNNPVEVRFN